MVAVPEAAEVWRCRSHSCGDYRQGTRPRFPCAQSSVLEDPEQVIGGACTVWDRGTMGTRFAAGLSMRAKRSQCSRGARAERTLTRTEFHTRRPRQTSHPPHPQPQAGWRAPSPAAAAWDGRGIRRPLYTLSLASETDPFLRSELCRTLLRFRLGDWTWRLSQTSRRVLKRHEHADQLIGLR